MKTCFVLVAFLCSLSAKVHSQPIIVPDSTTLQAMQKFEFLNGHWSGTGWMQLGRDKHHFNQEETISYKLNNSVLIVDGLGIDAETKKVAHQAYAVISYDRSAQKYLMRAFRGDGNYVDADVSFDDDGSLVWGFYHPQGGKVKYTIRLVDGKWVEKGEMSQDNMTWFPFLEMTLSRK